MNRKMIHTALIDLHRMYEEIGHELNDYERMRKGVPENQRGKLEGLIEKRKRWMKEIKDIELNLRSELD